MNIFCVGIDHQSTSVEAREALSVAGDELEQTLRFFSLHRSFQEVVILSTCNRVEFYFVSRMNKVDLVKELVASLNEFRRIEVPWLKHAYVLRNEKAVQHLFEVAGGLHSMVIGETEILGQIKAAYEKARSLKVSGKLLNRLFQHSFSVAKTIRTHTQVGYGNVSVASVGVAAAERIVGNFPQKKVLVLGAGETSEKVARILVNKGVRQLYFSNRSLSKAKNLADDLKGLVIAWEEWKGILPEIDIILSSTAAPYHILDKDDLCENQARREEKPLFIIDLAVPRDVDPEVGKMKDVHLFNIDDLKEMSSENIEARLSEREKAFQMVGPYVEELMGYYLKHQLIVEPFERTQSDLNLGS